jgi:hypothetical protein
MRSSVDASRTATIAADPDAEQPLLPLLLATAKVRDLTYDDFPDHKALPWPEQRQLIELSLTQGKVNQAELLAIPCGFRERHGGRTLWQLRRWLKRMGS